MHSLNAKHSLKPHCRAVKIESSSGDASDSSGGSSNGCVSSSWSGNDGLNQNVLQTNVQTVQV